MTRIFTKIFSAALMGLTTSTVLATDTNPTTAPAAVAAVAPVLKHDPRVEVFPFTAVSGAPSGQANARLWGLIHPQACWLWGAPVPAAGCCGAGTGAGLMVRPPRGRAS